MLIAKKSYSSERSQISGWPFHHIFVVFLQTYDFPELCFSNFHDDQNTGRLLDNCLKNYLKLRFGDWLFKLLWSFKKRLSGVRPWTDSIFKETLPSATIWRLKSWPVLTLRYRMDNGQAEKVFLLPQCVM